MNSSYTVNFHTFCKDLSFDMTFSYGDITFLEFEVDNTLFVEDWQFFVEHIRDTDDQRYSLIIQKDDGGRVELISFKDTFGIKIGINGCSNGSICLYLVKNESLFQAFEELVLVLKEIDEIDISDVSDHE